jgi:integrase/recombinase XerD
VAAWERFIREKQYVKNLSEKTISDYQCAWLKWCSALPGSTDQINETTIEDVVMFMRQEKLSPTSVNSYLRVLKVFVRWLGVRTADGDPLSVPMIKAPTLVPRTFTAAQQRALLAAKPKSRCGQRVLLLAKLYLNTAARAEEIIALRLRDVNLDDLLIKIEGKGARERIVPFSLGLRGDLVLWIDEHIPDPRPESWLFPTPRGHILYRNMHRDFVALCKSVGIVGRRMGFHSLRHTFGSHYIAAGGDPLRLQRILGHSSLAMTARYVQIQTKDLSEVHERFAPGGAQLQRKQLGKAKR